MLSKKRLFPVWALLAVAALMFVYCGDSDEPTEPVDPLAGAALCLSDSSCTMGSVCDTSAAIDVTNCGNSTVLSWTATDDAAWLSLSVTTGETPAQFCIMADSNRTGSDRTATVTVTADDLTDESIDIDVTQPTLSPTLCLSVSEWEPPGLGDESPAILVTNCGDMSSFDWQVTEDEDWLELSVTSGSTPGSFTITADANEAEVPRTGTVTVTASGVQNSPGVIAITQSSAITLAGSWGATDEAYAVYISGDLAYVADASAGLQIIDVSDPVNPTLIGNYDTPDDARDVYVSGDYAYVADDASGLQIINASDPADPTYSGSFNTSGYAYGVFVSGIYASVADLYGGFKIIDVSSPSSPALTGTLSTASPARGVHVAGDYAYVAAENKGLLLINISDANNPTLDGSYDTEGTARSVFVSGDYAYVADDASGLQIVEVSDPNNPVLAGSCATTGDAWDVHVSGDYAYVAGFTGGLQIIDISDPVNPVLVTSYDTPSFAYGVHISGDYAYVADGETGLLILKLGL